MILLALIGPEHLGRRFGVAHDSDMADAAGRDTIAAIVHQREAMGHDNLDEASSDGDEKTRVGQNVV